MSRQEEYQIEYEKWLFEKTLTAAEHGELEAIKGSEQEIRERFSKPLTFGTAGLRERLGLGIGRMNLYTVCQATQGLATFIAKLGSAVCKRGVAIAYDCRYGSVEFAEAAAEVLAAAGIRVWLFDGMRPTPELSFAVLHNHCIAGINITASHNTREYNGYKVYWENGAQLPPEEAAAVAETIARTDVFRGVHRLPLAEAKAKGLVTMLGAETDEAFLQVCLQQSVAGEELKKAAETMKVVYTPFHGTGYRLVPEILKRAGLKAENLICDPRQSIPDPAFSTVRSPNPQDREGFTGAIALAKENQVDLILGTDPDADRIGIVVRDAQGEYQTLTGNQTACLLTDFVIRIRQERHIMPKNPAIIKSIVTTEMARTIAEKNGVFCADTFTGFKFLAEKIREFETSGSHQYLLAFEESYGYLTGDGARDKDAVTAALLITEMAAWYYNRGITLMEALEDLYRRYGYYCDETVSMVFAGLDGQEKMRRLMEHLRQTPPETIAGVKVQTYRDYLPGEEITVKTGNRVAMELKNSNVLSFVMADGSTFVIRPSGTEPKIRAYIMVHGHSHEECRALAQRYIEAANALAE